MRLRLDPRALLTQPTPEELSAYRRGRKGRLPAGMIIARLVLALMALAFLSVIAVQAFTGVLNAGSGRYSQGTAIVVLTIAVLVGAGLWWAHRRGVVKQYRLERFAADNGLRFSAMQPPAHEPGLVFGVGNSRRFIQRFDSLDGEPSWWAGNYRYTTGSGKNTRTFSWGVFCIRLSRQMPHLVLDATSNNIFRASNLPVRPSGTQRLSLEGDFDKHFTLYCPTGYERDALYVFTPDVMAALIDATGNYDVEIVQDRLYCYRAIMDFNRPEQWLELQRVAEHLGARTLRQTRRYADERIGDASIDYVAPRGQRLRTSRLSMWTIIAVAIFAAVFLLNTLGSFF